MLRLVLVEAEHIDLCSALHWLGVVISSISLLNLQESPWLAVMAGGMFGYDVARWVQRNRPHCNILWTSGFNEQMGEEGDVNVDSCVFCRSHTILMSLDWWSTPRWVKRAQKLSL